MQADRTDRLDHGVFLHIESEDLIHPEFKKFPDHADRHRKTERNDRHKERRQFKFQPVAPVQQIYHRKSDRRSQKSIERMQHRIPKRKCEVKLLDLP